MSTVSSDLFSPSNTWARHRMRPQHVRSKCPVKTFLSFHVCFLCVSFRPPSDGLVVVGVHSAKFPNEKVRPVRFVCAFFLYFCNWKVSRNSCHFGNALKFKTVGNKETFSEAIKRTICWNNKYENVQYLIIIIFIESPELSCVLFSVKSLKNSNTVALFYSSLSCC